MIGIAPCMHAGPGLRHPDPDAAAAVALRRGRRDPEGDVRGPIPGDPQDPGTLCGPVISAKQRERVLGYIQKGIDEGAKLSSAAPMRRPGSTRGSGSSRRCSSTSTTR